MQHYSSFHVHSQPASICLVTILDFQEVINHVAQLLQNLSPGSAIGSVIRGCLLGSHPEVPPYH